MKANYNGSRFFLAAEQGAGKHKNSVTIAINPKMINKAKEQIANEHPKLGLKEEQIR